MRRLVAAALVAAVSSATAQDSTASLGVRASFVNDEWERYMRVLQLSGEVRTYPWSIRAFGLSEVDALAPRSAHPWARAGMETQSQLLMQRRRVQVTRLPVRAQFMFNSAIPFGFNDGPVWAGRGATTVVESGVSARYGSVSVTLAPVLFRAENKGFELMRLDNAVAPDAYGDWVIDGGIDQPQRFGPDAYQRLDPGNSSVRIDAGIVAAGFSTANDHWGPARDHPAILGNNAAGFPHFFAGSSRPISIGVGQLHGRMIWGKLAQTPYSYMRAIQSERFATGIVGVFVPRGLPGLEIGGSRFFHLLWTDTTVSGNWLRSFSSVLPGRRIGSAGDNQLASVFARWVFPRGLEAYAEFVREDHNANVRDFFLEPDQNAGYLVGAQRVIGEGEENRQVVRGEVLNTRISSINIFRPQTRFYTHGAVGQGHTHRGEVLGSIGGFGGGAATLGYDRYSPAGRTTVALARLFRAQKRDDDLHAAVPGQADVMHALTLDGLRYRGRYAITYEATAVYELNRNFQRDVFNLRLASGIQLVW